ncbi:glycosyltransferase family 1 protein [Novosphingobium sp.]|uniref:glycosyltransferase family 4 protein n=1 Tax=Novosphingobium sp. TaxID=1874826 RepID=UPI00286C3D99|nr:glycosyltransferase family 1 protein [Novosphingobium sp.]
MPATGLRIALFSGNYNITVDGANRALNRLVGYLLRQGAAVRVYSPTTGNPGMAPTGDLVSLPSLPIPLRPDYRLASGINARIRKDLAEFNPNLLHVSAPDVGGHRAIAWARKHGVPVVASVHTRFETYLPYYKLGFLVPAAIAIQRRFYNRCDALLVPSQSMVDVLRAERMGTDISIWSRGVDRTIFSSDRRDMAWRRAQGFAGDDFVIGFLSRVVMEKGLDVFANTIDELRRRGVKHKLLVVGDGPARDWFSERLGDAVFTGYQSGSDLGRAVAAMDTMLFPSETEAFGNVSLEAMASGVPVVAAAATGSENIVENGVSGYLVAPGDVAAYADAVASYALNPALCKAHGAASERLSRAYDWDTINQAVADTYLRVIRSQQPKA